MPLTTSRDLRLDLFRGLALVFIFIDHMPGNRLTEYTIRNLGFSDASELFVFISAYTAGLVNMRRVSRDGLASASQRIGRRATQIYLAHLLVLVITCVLAGWLTRAFDNPQFVQGLNVGPFLEQPFRTFVEAMALLFQPTFMNILPLYVVLFLFLPLVLWLIRKNQMLALTISVLLYVMARGYPGADNPFGATWQFNPLSWQLLFVIGVSLGAATGTSGLVIPRLRALLAVSVAYLVWALWVHTLAWGYDGSTLSLPEWIRVFLFPVMDRSNLSLWRLTHILSLVYVTAYLVRANQPWLRSSWVQPLVLIGQHSLMLFCVGVILSVLGWAMLTELGSGLTMQILVNVGGFAVMATIGWLLSPRPLPAGAEAVAHQNLPRTLFL